VVVVPTRLTSPACNAYVKFCINAAGHLTVGGGSCSFKIELGWWEKEWGAGFEVSREMGRIVGGNPSSNQTNDPSPLDAETRS
jgi:hypothetical protein